MALHIDLPIYRTGVQLLSLAVKVQEQMPRGVKRSLGDKISQHCVEMLDLMALANATRVSMQALSNEVLNSCVWVSPDSIQCWRVCCGMCCE